MRERAEWLAKINRTLNWTFLLPSALGFFFFSEISRILYARCGGIEPNYSSLEIYFKVWKQNFFLFTSKHLQIKLKKKKKTHSRESSRFGKIQRNFIVLVFRKFVQKNEKLIIIMITTICAKTNKMRR